MKLWYLPLPVQLGLDIRALHEGGKSAKKGYTANVNRQTADNLSFSYAVITGENV